MPGKKLTDIFLSKTLKDSHNNQLIVRTKKNAEILADKVVFEGKNNTVILGENCIVSDEKISVITIQGNGNLVSLDEGCNADRCVITIRGNNNKYHAQKSQTIKELNISVSGDNNILIFGESGYATASSIAVNGNRNAVSVGRYWELYGTEISLSSDNNELQIGIGVIINASEKRPTILQAVGGKKISIGNGSLLSNNIQMYTTDYHGIYDRKGNRVNNNKDIIIGNHVWIGIGALILKGTEIADGCIVGAGSVVSGKKKIPNSIVAGNPANIIKNDVFWAHEAVDHIDNAEKYFY